MATLVINRGYAVRLYTPEASDLLQLTPADLGRDLRELDAGRRDPTLQDDIALLFADGRPRERLIGSVQQRPLLRRLALCLSAAHGHPDVLVTYAARGEPPAAAPAALHEAALEQHRVRVDQQATERALAAEAASQAKSAFLAQMSHELRTPLGAIIGLTHLLRRSVVAPECLDKLAMIAGAADHLLAIVNGILDLSKIEAGKVVLDTTVFEIDAVLARVASMVADRIEAKGLELIVDSGPPATPVRGDPTRLTQALLNYLGNAVKFTERGSIALRACPIEEGADGTRIRFEVQDSGIGIAPEHLPRLFHAFEQGDASTMRRFGGTGLGLAITRHLAALMGGEVGVSSTPGVGSLFWMTARFARADLPDGCARSAALLATP